MRALQIQLVHELVVAPLEERRQLDVALLRRDLHFDLTVRVIDDGNEHVQENEKDKEYVGEEKYGTEDSIRLFHGTEIEITQYQTK